MTRSQGILRARGDALEETQFFFNQWQRDCQAMAPAHQWRDGVPVVLGADRMAWLVQESDGLHRIAYVLVNGALRRIDSGAYSDRGTWLADWQTLAQGGSPTGQVTALTVPGVVGFQARLWAGANGWSVAPPVAPGVLVRGLEMDLALQGTPWPLRQVCLTGQD